MSYIGVKNVFTVIYKGDKNLKEQIISRSYLCHISQPLGILENIFHIFALTIPPSLEIHFFPSNIDIPYLEFQRFFYFTLFPLEFLLLSSTGDFLSINNSNK